MSNEKKDMLLQLVYMHKKTKNKFRGTTSRDEKWLKKKVEHLNKSYPEWDYSVEQFSSN